MKDTLTENQVNQFVNYLKVFKIGMSWGGVTSLALAYPKLDRPDQSCCGRIIRFNVGLEDTKDLIEELGQAFMHIDGGSIS